MQLRSNRKLESPPAPTREGRCGQTRRKGAVEGVGFDLGRSLESLEEMTLVREELLCPHGEPTCDFALVVFDLARTGRCLGYLTGPDGSGNICLSEGMKVENDEMKGRLIGLEERARKAVLGKVTWSCEARYGFVQEACKLNERYESIFCEIHGDYGRGEPRPEGTKCAEPLTRRWNLCAGTSDDDEEDVGRRGDPPKGGGAEPRRS